MLFEGACLGSVRDEEALGCWWDVLLIHSASLETRDAKNFSATTMTKPQESIKLAPHPVLEGYPLQGVEGGKMWQNC